MYDLGKDSRVRAVTTKITACSDIAFIVFSRGIKTLPTLGEKADGLMLMAYKVSMAFRPFFKAAISLNLNRLIRDSRKVTFSFTISRDAEEATVYVTYGNSNGIAVTKGAFTINRVLAILAFRNNFLIGVCISPRQGLKTNSEKAIKKANVRLQATRAFGDGLIGRFINFNEGVI